MSNSKHFNGVFVTEYLKTHERSWKSLVNHLWNKNEENQRKNYQQSKNYFLEKKDISTSTLWTLHEVTGLPLEMFFIGDDEQQPDIKTVDSRIDIHHNHIDTLNANSNPEVLLAYLEMSKSLCEEKDKRILAMQMTINSLSKDRDDLLRRYPEAVHPDLK